MKPRILFAIVHRERSPLAPLEKGGTGECGVVPKINNVLKVPLNKGDLGGFSSQVPLNKGDLGGSSPRETAHRERSPLALLEKGGTGECGVVPKINNVLKVPLNKGDLGGFSSQVPLIKGDLGGFSPRETAHRERSPLAPLEKGGTGECGVVPKINN
ncbi:MAG: hypothetical protein D6680_22570, partial [Cyanobacteria bacterium J007]